jgi:metal-responsive CopG/Arc/MetJ family transcriptional regulator
MFFDERIETRLRSEEMIKLDEIIRKKKEIYTNRSNFFRIAVIKLINTEKEKEQESNKNIDLSL